MTDKAYAKTRLALLLSVKQGRLSEGLLLLLEAVRSAEANIESFDRRIALVEAWLDREEQEHREEP